LRGKLVRKIGAGGPQDIHEYIFWMAPGLAFGVLQTDKQRFIVFFEVLSDGEGFLLFTQF
jgi:hypothetical protein